MENFAQIRSRVPKPRIFSRLALSHERHLLSASRLTRDVHMAVHLAVA